MCSVVVTTQRLLLPWLLLQMIAFDRCLPDDPLTQLEATLTEHGWLNDQILAQLNSGLRFWFLERKLCKVEHPCDAAASLDEVPLVELFCSSQLVS